MTFFVHLSEQIAGSKGTFILNCDKYCEFFFKDILIHPSAVCNDACFPKVLTLPILGPEHHESFEDLWLKVHFFELN